MYYIVIRVASGPNMTGSVTNCASEESAFKMHDHNGSAEVKYMYIAEDHTTDLFGVEFKVSPIQYNNWSTL